MSDSEFEAEQEKEAAAEAAAIGGRASSEPPTEYEQGLSEADRPADRGGRGRVGGIRALRDGAPGARLPRRRARRPPDHRGRRPLRRGRGVRARQLRRGRRGARPRRLTMSQTGARAGGRSAVSSCRRCTDLRSRRETCICETPTSSRDLGLGEVLAEAQIEDRALALGQMLGGREHGCLLVDELQSPVLVAEHVQAAARPLRRSRCGARRARRCRSASAICRPSSTSSSLHSRYTASSGDRRGATVGARRPPAGPR